MQKVLSVIAQLNIGKFFQCKIAGGKVISNTGWYKNIDLCNTCSNMQ